MSATKRFNDIKLGNIGENLIDYSYDYFGWWQIYERIGRIEQLQRDAAASRSQQRRRQLPPPASDGQPTAGVDGAITGVAAAAAAAAKTFRTTNSPKVIESIDDAITLLSTVLSTFNSVKLGQTRSNSVKLGKTR